jgi:hypothetical protein
MRIVLAAILVCALMGSTLIFAGCPGPTEEFVFTVIAGQGGTIRYAQLGGLSGLMISPGNPYIGKFPDASGIGDHLTLTALPNTGYVFDAWYLIDGSTKINLTTFDFADTGIHVFNAHIHFLRTDLFDAVIEAHKDMKNLTLTAEFKPLSISFYAYSDNLSMGDVFANGIQAGGNGAIVEAFWDMPVSMKAVPHEGFKFIGWYDTHSYGENPNLISTELEFDYIAGAKIITMGEHNEYRYEFIHAWFAPID